MAAKITKITSAQAARFGEWSKKWIEIGLSTEPADFDRATKAALEGYRLCNLKKPMVVLRMGSPYAATLGGILAWSMMRQFQEKIKIGSNVRAQVWDQVWAQVGAQVGDQVGDQVWAQVWAQVRDQVGAQVGAQVRDQVWAQVRDQVGAQVRAQVGAQVGAQVRDQVRAQVGAQVRAQVGAQVWAQVGAQVRAQVWAQVRDQVWAQVRAQVGAQVWAQGAYNYGPCSLWANSAAYITFMRDVLGWDGSTLEKFKVDEELTQSCGWTWWHENVLAISDRPKEIHRDTQNRLHGETGPSIAYRDGWVLHHWHGVSIPAEWINDRKSLTPKMALTWGNVEQRRCACEILGWANILSELNAKSIDKDSDPEIGELVEVNIPDSGKEKFLRVLCGTGRSFALPVPREMKTALQAQAWTWALDTKDFTKPEIRT